MLEYQSRDSAALLKASTAPTSEQSGGLFSYDNSITSAGRIETEAEKREKALQQRIGIYLSERRYVIKCATFLVRASISKGSAWKEAGQRLVSELKVGDNDTLGEIIKAIRKRVVQGDGDPPQWVKDKIAEDSVEGREILYEWEKQV